MQFDKWSDSQRKQLLSDLIGKSKSRQIEYTGDIINKKRPVRHEDFTRLLPRVLSLYLFSFLDPRSLCRCSRVCQNQLNYPFSAGINFRCQMPMSNVDPRAERVKYL